jgi:enoyl-CoA hydratase/carnithine racemase
MINIVRSVDDKLKLVQLSDELAGLCAEMLWNEEIRVVILSGAGEESFSIVKGSVGVAWRLNEEQQIKVLSVAGHITKLARPVIAAVNGYVIGQGLELVLSCDIRIASEISHFGLPQIKTGLIPWDGGTQRLSRLVGRGKALEMILTGEIIDAEEALRIGLVHKVVPKKDLTEVAMKMAQGMASKGPIALRYAKEAIYKGMDLTLEQGLRLETNLYLLIHATKDRTEGIHAFREKRAPKFEGK